MTSEFRKGQLVAVYDDECSKWYLWIYDHASPEGMHFCRSPIRMIAPRWWKHAVPAEEIWSGIFLEGHRRDELVYRQALDKAHDQIKWLCGQLNRLSQDSGNCLLPAGAGIPSDDSCRVGGCDACWLIAAKKATGEDADDLE